MKYQSTSGKNIANLLMLVLVALTVSCGSDSSNDDNSNQASAASTPYVYNAPVSLNDGWQVAHLQDLAIEVAPFEQLMEKIDDETNGYRYIDHVLVVKDNTIVFDELLRTELDFADDWGNNKDLNLHILNSVTKSVNSALIGIAIEQGYIENVNVKVHDYFQHKLPIANWNEDKANVTLDNWLNMRHGYQWDEWNVSYLDASNQNSQMNRANDPIQFLLDLPMASVPGNTFAYSTGVSYGLGRILSIASGQSVTRFMEQYLFEPLGIEKYDYWALDGQLHTGSALYLSARDMAKFGQLFLNNGQWLGQQIVPQAWVEKSSTRQVDNGSWGYGNQWWMTAFKVGETDIDAFYADGFGGQFIFVLPFIDAVVVFNGRAYEQGQSEQYDVYRIMANDILPALLNSP